MMDPSIQNTLNLDHHMRQLAYSIEAARAACAPGVDKITVIMNLEDFSLRNATPKASILEFIEIVCIVYPETMGTCIVWQIPKIAYMTLSSIARPFIDRRTWSKMHFLYGDSSPNSECDRVMKDVVGPDWRVVTGLGQPRTQTAYSEYYQRDILCARGFNFASYWQHRQQSDLERAAACGGPPWRHLTPEAVLDAEQWDGAFPGFWQSSLLGGRATNADNTPGSTFKDVDLDTLSEAWATPPQSETEDTEPAQSVQMPAPVLKPSTVGRPALPLPQKVSPPRGSPTSGSDGVRSTLPAPQPCCSGLCCVGYGVLLLSVLLALHAATETILREHRGVGPSGPLAHSRGLLLLDVSLAGIGLGLAAHTTPAPAGAGFLHTTCVPWAILLLRMFSMPEAIRTVVRAMKGKESAIGSVFIVVSLEVADAFLSTCFALMWIRRRMVKAHKKNVRYARLSDDVYLP